MVTAMTVEDKASLYILTGQSMVISPIACRLLVRSPACAEEIRQTKNAVMPESNLLQGFSVIGNVKHVLR